MCARASLHYPVTKGPWMTKALGRGTVCWRGRAARARLGGGMEERRHQRKRRAWELNSPIPGRPSPTHDLPHPLSHSSFLPLSPQRSRPSSFSSHSVRSPPRFLRRHQLPRCCHHRRHCRRPPRARPVRSHAPRPGRRWRPPHDSSHSPLAVVFPAFATVMFDYAWTRRARRPALFSVFFSRTTS